MRALASARRGDRGAQRRMRGEHAVVPGQVHPRRGVGAWLGTIMLFNVWVFIWPNQKKILGIVAATDEQKAAARKTALYASRTGTVA